MFDSLNRVGIALNFIAGFMLAPQLIGEPRLRRFEGWTTEQAGRISTAVLRRRPWYGEGPRPEAAAKADWHDIRRTSLTVFGLAAAWCAVFTGLQLLRGGGLPADDWQDIVVNVLLVFAVCLPAWGAVLFAIVMQLMDPSAPDPPWLDTAFWAALTPFAPVLLVIGVPALVADIAVATLGALARAIDRHLRSTRWLEGTLTSLGIVAFSLGNALQFSATFE